MVTALNIGHTSVLSGSWSEIEHHESLFNRIKQLISRGRLVLHILSIAFLLPSALVVREKCVH